MRLKNLSKKQLAIVVVILAAVIIVFALVLSFMTQKRPSQVAKPAVPTAIVSITENGFVPATLSIKNGQTVKWVNNDEASHRVASNPHPTHTGLPGFDSKNNLEKGASFTFTFDKTGNFGYHDHLNPQTFQGVISVQ